MKNRNNLIITKCKPDKSNCSYKSLNYLQTDINTHTLSYLMSNFYPMAMSYYFMILRILEYGEMLKLSSQKNSNKGSPT